MMKCRPKRRQQASAQAVITAWTRDHREQIFSDGGWVTCETDRSDQLSHRRASQTETIRTIRRKAKQLLAPGGLSQRMRYVAVYYSAGRFHKDQRSMPGRVAAQMVKGGFFRGSVEAHLAGLTWALFWGPGRRKRWQACPSITTMSQGSTGRIRLEKFYDQYFRKGTTRKRWHLQQFPLRNKLIE